LHVPLLCLYAVVATAAPVPPNPHVSLEVCHADSGVVVSFPEVPTVSASTCTGDAVVQQLRLVLNSREVWDLGPMPCPAHNLTIAAAVDTTTTQVQTAYVYAYSSAGSVVLAGVDDAVPTLARSVVCAGAAGTFRPATKVQAATPKVPGVMRRAL
jgi:hypothetical protein